MDKTVVAVIGAVIAVAIIVVVAIEVFNVPFPNISQSGQSNAYSGETNITQVYATANALLSRVNTLNTSSYFSILLKNGSNPVESISLDNVSFSLYGGMFKGVLQASPLFLALGLSTSLPPAYKQFTIRFIALQNGTANITCSNSWVLSSLKFNQSVANKEAVNCTYVPSAPLSHSVLTVNGSTSILSLATEGDLNGINSSWRMSNLGTTTINGQQCTMFKETYSSAIVAYLCMSDSSGLTVFLNSSFVNDSYLGPGVKIATLFTSLPGNEPTAASITSLPQGVFGSTVLREPFGEFTLVGQSCSPPQGLQLNLTDSYDNSVIFSGPTNTLSTANVTFINETIIKSTGITGAGKGNASGAVLTAGKSITLGFGGICTPNSRYTANVNIWYNYTYSPGYTGMLKINKTITGISG